MIRTNPRFLLPAALLCAVAAQAEPEKVVLRHIDPHPASEAAARRTIRRIDSAALQACGVSDSALREVQAATRKGDCWREAVGDVVRQARDPRLAVAFARIAPAAR